MDKVQREKKKKKNPVGARYFSFLQKHPPSLLFNGYRVYFPGAKRPSREVKHSSPFDAEVKNVWSYVASWQRQGKLHFYFQ
jgi:hypothetical protein